MTGGAGFIGSHLVEELIGRGEVFVLDNLYTGSLENLKGLSTMFIKGRAKEVNNLEERFDFIFHLGIYSSSPMYRENRFLVNLAVEDFLYILEYAREKGSKVILASSSSIYNGNEPPFREDMEIKVTDFYTEARYYLERLASLYFDFYGVKTVVLRLFSVYGEKEKHKGKFANLVTQFLWKMSKGERPVIYGDGSQTRDFIYVKDVVKAFILAMEKNIGFDVFNVGTGKSYSLNQVVEILNRKLGVSIKPLYISNPIKNYVEHTLADTGKAERLLGFKSKFTLEGGVEKLIKYYL